LLHDRLWNGHRGVVTDTDTLYLDDFVTPGGGLAFSGAISTLWVAQQGGEAKRIKVPGNPTAFGRVFSWSTDGRYLSVSYERDDLPRNDKLYAQTSIGVVEPATGVFREVARARGPSAGAAAVKYSGGQWVDGKRIIIRREKDEHIWVSPALLEWTVVDAALGRGIEHSSWWQGPPNGWTSTNVWPVDSSSILAESTDRGVKTLLRVSASGSSYSQLIEGVGGSSSRFSFSADGSLAFINESLSRAPEVYFRDKQGHVRRLTNMNAGVQQHVRFTEREVHWRSLRIPPMSASDSD
jgi:dipeptidyl aminopeptidase/acylaminoacyl peptidase